VTNNDGEPTPKTCNQETTNEVFVLLEAMEETSISEWLDTLNVLESVSVDLHLDFTEPSRDGFHSFTQLPRERLSKDQSLLLAHSDQSHSILHP
jgi:hypothetical protein